MAKISIYNKLIAGGTPKKSDLEKETKKRKLLNNKYKTARSTLETNGGVANIKGEPINNAFFNHAMGHETDAADFTPSPTGLAIDSGAVGDAGAGDASAGVGAGGE